MWRSLFLALGLYLVLVGVEGLLVEKVTLVSREDRGLFGPAERREIAPAPWVPWSLMSSGAVTILYSFTLPRRLGKSGGGEE